MNIIDYIPYGKENAITREQLSKVTGLPDRAMRKEIELARRDTCIINNQNGKGYYRPTDKAEVERYIKQEESRAKKIFMALGGARKYQEEMKGQIKFNV